MLLRNNNNHYSGGEPWTMDHFVGIDLHSNNSYIAVIDTDNNRTFKTKFVIGNLSHP